jgi:outer membrane receptor protein involved in Fe transport
MKNILVSLLTDATRLAALLFLLAFAAPASGQMPAGGNPPSGFDPSKMNIGRFYGKVVDENGKGVGYATVRLFGMKFDPETKTLKESLLGGQITADNGDFSLEKLPVVGDFTLKVEYIGYAEVTKTVTFGIKPPAGGPESGKLTGNFTPPAGGSFPPQGGFPGGGAGANFDKDLGNIALASSAKELKEVTITAKAQVATLALDRKIYRVDKDLSTAGGNAQDALKNVPSLSVDLDGNVSLRNGAPQIFVDGRPTTLSLDQISADAIESVEVITNPSAKYDAGGGTAGIVNIVLKKEKRLGYNGNVRTGADSRGGFNLGGDINARGEKINLFASGNLNQNRNISEGQTFRQNFYGEPFSNLTQTTEGKIQGLFANGRAGVDWLVDNRNTLTLSGNYTRGKFNPSDVITTRTDLLFFDTTASSQYVRSSLQDRNFRNLGASFQFKHLFPKQGAEWTADVNYNRVRFMGGSEYNTLYDNGLESREQQEGLGQGQFVTFQSDFVNPITDKIKIEGGVRAALRRNRSDNANYTFNLAENEWNQVTSLTDHYKFSDDVYAAYGTFSQQFGKWGYQVGLRAESSFYTGALTDRDSSFTIAYPVSLFPSVFVTRKLNESDNIQLSYTRRVNRPNFFQTMPFIDFSDSLNLRRGNVQLRPEFTNALELTYQNVFSKGHNLLVSLYFKQATDLITSYLTTEYNADLQREVVITSYANANSSYAYGAEVTVKNSLFGWLDLTTNLNVYQSRVDASNVESDLTISRLSGFLKENMQVKLPAGFSFQLNGEWRSRASFTPSNNNDPFRGGPGGGAAANTAQGYSISNWFADASLRKDILDNKGTLTLSVNDLFRTRRNGTYTASELFEQDTYRLFGPQTVRLNFAYRFGKMDASLFKRKNMKQSMQGGDMMQ